MKIAVLGIDGVGKSTVIDKLKNNFNNKSTHFHFMPQKHKVKKLKTDNFDDVKSYNLLVSHIKIIYVIIKFSFLWFFNVFLKKNDIIIFDRVIFDLAIHPERYLIHKKTFGLNCLFTFRFLFDHIMILHCDENVIYSRCKENSLESIVEIQNKYLLSSKRYNFNLIDTNDSILNTERNIFDILNN